MCNQEAAQRRLDALRGMKELVVDSEMEALAAKLIAEGGIPAEAEVDALHVACALEWGAELFASSDKQQLTVAKHAGLKTQQT